jgi:hypothetical protein
VDLDRWTEEQVQKMVEGGNTKANEYWAAKLQPNVYFKHGNRDNFIRSKYEKKEFLFSSIVSKVPVTSPPVTVPSESLLDLSEDVEEFGEFQSVPPTPTIVSVDLNSELHVLDVPSNSSATTNRLKQSIMDLYHQPKGLESFQF